MKCRIRTAALVTLVVILISNGLCLATDRTIRLRDRINHEWSHELVNYDLVFEPGTCHISTMILEGPAGPVAFQLSPNKDWWRRQTDIRTPVLPHGSSGPGRGDLQTSVRYQAPGKRQPFRQRTSW